MSLPDNSINPKILESAKEEFLSKGFQNASLRDICKKADVTTGALYKRFSGKDALFEAVVSPVLEDIAKLTKSIEQYNNERLEYNEMDMIWGQSEETTKKFIEFIYSHYDGFKLLLCCADGTAHSTFIHDFVTEHAKKTLMFTYKAFSAGLINNKIDESELHILLSAYWTALFETVIHNFPKEKALYHCGIVAKFFNWGAIWDF